MKSSKNIIIIIGFFLFAILCIYLLSFFSKEEQSHYDSREESCLGKEIDAIDFNIDTKKCFETKISACQKSTYVSIEECNKLNGL